MAAIRKVKLGGKPIADVVSASVKIRNRVDHLGCRQGKTLPAQIELVRVVDNTGITKFFEAATNGDGRVRAVDVSFEILNPGFGTAYVVTARNAIAQTYRHEDTDDSAVPTGTPAPPSNERIILTCGDLDISAGGKTITYKLDDFSLDD